METTSFDESIEIAKKRVKRVSTWVPRYVAPIILCMADYVAIVISLFCACFFRSEVVPLLFPLWPVFTANEFYVFVGAPLIYLLFFLYDGSYTRRLPLWQGVERVFCICFYVSALAILLMYFLGKAEQISRLVVCMSWLFSLVTLCLTRIVVKRILIAAGFWQRPVIIVGAGKTAELLCRAFERDKGLGYKVIGVLEDAWHERPLLQQIPHLGTFSEAEKVIKRSGVQDVILAVPGVERGELVELMYRLQPYARNLTVVPDLFGIPMGNMTIDTLFDEKTVLLRIHNNLLRKRNRICKRLFDLVFGSILLALLMIPMVCISSLIRLDSCGKAFFNAQRIGLKGKFFTCYKFRTMHENSEDLLNEYLDSCPRAKQEWDEYAKLRQHDPRVTRLGLFLRKYSLDELPQLINVIEGTMSLVGPRPYLPREKDNMQLYFDDITSTVPGVTGLWQVSGRNDVSFEQRLEMDSWYVRNWSVWLDLVILAKTFHVVLGRKGAY